MGENQEQVQHLEINIPEWLANSNDQIVIICNDSDDVDNGDPGQLVTVPLDAILNEANQNQVVVQMEASQPIPQALYEIRRQVEEQTPENGKDVPLSSNSEQDRKVVTQAEDALTAMEENVDDKSKIQVEIREADENMDAISGDNATKKLKDKVGQSNAGGSGDGRNVTKQTDTIVVIDSSSVKHNSNLNEHDYLAAKMPVRQLLEVSRRSKRKAAMSPQRKRCRAGCCEGDNKHNLTNENNIKLARKEVVSRVKLTSEEIAETKDIDASSKLTCDAATPNDKNAGAETDAEIVGTNMILRNKAKVSLEHEDQKKAVMAPGDIEESNVANGEGDNKHNSTNENNIKLARKEVVSRVKLTSEEILESKNIDASAKLTCDAATSNDKNAGAEIVGTNMILRNKAKVSLEHEDQKEAVLAPGDIEDSNVANVNELGDDKEKFSPPAKKTKKKGTMKTGATRVQDSFTITPDGIEELGPDESLPINIIKASKPKDVSSFSAELAVSVNTKFECVCGQTFTQKKSLIRHFRRKKPRADGLEEEGSEHYSKFPIAIYPNTKAPRKKPAPKSFPCPHCPKVLQTKAGIDYHIMSHTGFKPIECSLCGESFKSKQTLDQHFVIHSNTNELPHKCEECGRTYLTATRLRAHKKIHEERKFKCDLCTHTFVMAKDLRKHMRVHTGEKPFECNFCEERFHFSQDVKRHLKRFHIDKAPFTCTNCPKPVYFFREEEYTSHMKLHSNDSEFRCDVCLQTFPTYTTLRNHQMTHGDRNPFQCRYETCGQVFKCANDRYVHERKVHDTNLLYCQFCRLSFKKPSNFEEHQRKHADATYECRAEAECGMKFKQTHIRLRHEKHHKKAAKPRNSATKKKPVTTQEPGKKSVSPQEPEPLPVPSPATIYQCGICWKTYKNYPSLRDHVREHGNEFPYECRVAGCGVKFKRVYHRRKHEQSHTTDEIINSVIDSRLRANEEIIELSVEEPVGGGGESQQIEVMEHQPASVLEDSSATDEDATPMDETEIAVQYVLG